MPDAQDDMNMGSCPDGAADTAGLVKAFADAQNLLHRCGPEYTDRTIMAALQSLAQAMGADRAYVFRIRDAVSVDNTHEWCADGIAPLKAQLQRLPYETGDPFWQAFRGSGQAFQVDIRTVPVNTAFRQLLEEQEIRSLIASSLWSEGEIIGLVGLDFVRTHRQFTELEGSLMHAFAASLGLALNLADQARAHDRAQSELQLERARVTAMVSALPELLVETDNDGTIIGFNQSDPLVFALNPDEVIGRPPERVLPPRVAGIVRNAMKEVDHFGWSRSIPYTLSFPDGEKRFTLTATKRQGDHPRKPHGYLFVVRDVTESYLQDKQIRQLGRVAELSTNLIMLTDKNRGITWMNPACVARTGYSLSMALSRRPSDILHLYESAPDIAGDICNALDNGQGINTELQAHSRRGMSYWLDLNVQPLRSPEGHVLGYMVVGVDITSHKLAEARALRDKAHAMEATHEGIAILNPDGRFSYLNHAIRQVLRLPLDADVSALHWHELIPADHMAKLTTILSELTCQGYWSGEIMLPDAAGRDAWYDLSMSVQDDSSIFLIMRNITARKLAKTERERLRTQLQIAQSRQLMSQLAGGLAHDFANILAVIVGSVDMLQPRADADIAPGLARIRAAGRQGQALVANLMQLGKVKPTECMVDLQELLRQSVELVRPALGNGIAVAMECDNGAGVALADTTEMMQVLINLIMNATDAIGQKASAGGCITLRLTAHDHLAPQSDLEVGSISAGQPYAVIDISDTGTGISPDRRAEVFKPYFTTKRGEGTGLGLAIVAHVVASRGWGLKVLDAAGGGTIMRLYLPAPVRPAPAVLTDAAGPAQVSTQSLAGRNVLLVHEDDSVLQSLAEILSAAAAEVASSTDPSDALNAVREDPTAWDTVILDGGRRQVDGLDILQELAELNCKLQILLLTDPKELHFANDLDMGAATAFLPKPFSGAELIAVLARAPVS
ncbi:PAS domain-containing protein [Roseinatronobacter alkalisoli]|uniref:histidine kinase n=1 Tax=Roseinatronobacter alkalisoli TaxID=3028235 RepID=A0ABT5T7K0_9RHOB|nr:PAS domain-containing protein [Roseinatronobacter sp. HJB301]MDD7971098.1 PAS domain-containing protein [Roseinatronobacter sp. HJB301]